jgi:hypothetical protein
MALTLNLKRTGMAASLERRDLLQEMRERTLSEREIALEEIKVLMGADFHGWFNDVHRLRSAGKQAEYEDVIYKKLEELIKNSTNEKQIQ